MTESEILETVQETRGHLRLAEHQLRIKEMRSAVLHMWEAYRKLQQVLGVIAPMGPDT